MELKRHELHDLLWDGCLHNFFVKTLHLVDLNGLVCIAGPFHHLSLNSVGHRFQHLLRPIQQSVFHDCQGVVVAPPIHPFWNNIFFTIQLHRLSLRLWVALTLFPSEQVHIWWCPCQKVALLRVGPCQLHRRCLGLLIRAFRRCVAHTHRGVSPFYDLVRALL